VKTDSVNHISVYRHVFDRHLADKAVEDGAKLFTSTLIKDISIKNDGVYLSGKDAAFESKIVVFADGPNTLAYKKFGIGFRPDSDKTAISAVCEVEWKDNPLNQLEYYYGMDISPWGYGWTFPKRDTINVGVGCLYSKIRSNIAESLNFLLRKHPLTKEMFRDKKILGYSSATIPNAPAKRIFGERMLVVGDAAGMVDCVTGGGIGPAIIGGKIAGKTCADALENEDFSGKFLSRYQNSWQNTGIYTHIYSKYLLTNAFLYFYKFDKNAFVKLTAITQGGISNLPRTLKLLLWRKT
jgi:digeranylgeranylglycerophospholipid reductase